jgi:hypothetical protein
MRMWSPSRAFFLSSFRACEFPTPDHPLSNALPTRERGPSPTGSGTVPARSASNEVRANPGSASVARGPLHIRLRRIALRAGTRYVALLRRDDVGGGRSQGGQFVSIGQSVTTTLHRPSWSMQAGYVPLPEGQGWDPGDHGLTIANPPGRHIPGRLVTGPTGEEPVQSAAWDRPLRIRRLADTRLAPTKPVRPRKPPRSTPRSRLSRD